MKKVIISLLVVSLIVIANSCYYDKENLLYGSNAAACDTTKAISYAQDVVPLLNQYCYSCHSGSFPSGNITMGTYATDKALALNGKLYGSINWAPGYSAMPKGMAKFNSCQLLVVQRWINAGCLNN